MPKSLMASLDIVDSMTDQVLVEDKKNVRIIELNRPNQLNALTNYMLSKLLELFIAYEEDPDVKLIILKGKGRAFCAGGDVLNVVLDIKRGEWRKSVAFMEKQYCLDYVMATNTKPQVSILDGIVMGGGGGISIHGKFRVVTENTVFAMPENAIGIFPDVGASYFLSRLPGFFGEYVGLSGARLNGAEMLACGLATHFVPSLKLQSLEDELCRTVLSDSLTISEIIDRYTELPVVKENSAYNHLKMINKCFSHTTVEEIISSLETEAAKKSKPWISSALKSLKNSSPTSLKISLRSIREGRFQGVGECLIREYRIISHVMRAQLSTDIIEGCRAILVDKDKSPKWEPSRLDLVAESMVDKYFSRVDDKGWKDLEFPLRSKRSQSTMSRL